MYINILALIDTDFVVYVVRISTSMTCMYLIILISFKKKRAINFLWQKQEVTPVKRVLETPGFLCILSF